jgi:hypothetical protein
MLCKGKINLFLVFLLVFSFRSKAQNREQYKDTCLMLVPNTVSISDDGFKLATNCALLKFHIDFFTKTGKKIYSSDSTYYFNKQLYVPLWKYKEGEYKWQMRYSYIHDGRTIEQKAEGKTHFLR